MSWVAADLPVPPGFVLMRSSYLASMRAVGVDTELAALHREALTKVNTAPGCPSSANECRLW